MKKLLMMGAASFLLLEIALAMTAGKALAADINPISGYKTDIIISGQIEPGDDDKLLSVLQYRTKHKLRTTIVFLSSNGGSVGAALNMATLIEKLGTTAAVAPDNQCESACVLLFAAASRRLVSHRAMIGVHQARDQQDSSDSAVALAASEAMTKAFIHYNVPFTVIRKMVSTDGNQDSLLFFKDLIEWPNTLVLDDNGQVEQE